VEPVRIAIAGAEPAALIEALVRQLSDSTGLRCGSEASAGLDVIIAPAAGAQPAALTLLMPSPADAVLRAALLKSGESWSVLPADPALQLEAALDALTPLLLKRSPPCPGLFSRLQAREAAQPAWRWVCEKCDVPECEHATFNLGSVDDR